MLAPLAADLSLATAQLEKENEGTFGSGGPDAQAFGLFNSACAAGLVFGPVFAGAIYDKAGWKVAMWALAGVCASGMVPVVSAIFSRPITVMVTARLTQEESLQVHRCFSQGADRSPSDHCSKLEIKRSPK